MPVIIDALGKMMPNTTVKNEFGAGGTCGILFVRTYHRWTNEHINGCEYLKMVSSKLKWLVHDDEEEP